jgi:hypothetical protein
MTEEQQIQEESGNDKSVETMDTNDPQEQQDSIDHKNITEKREKESKGDKNNGTKSTIPKKWSEMEQEETTHSVRVDGVKLRNRTTPGEEREIITGQGDQHTLNTTNTENDNTGTRPIHVKKKETTNGERNIDGWERRPNNT